MSYAYVTLVTNNTYIPGVIALAKSLRFVKSHFELLVCYTENVSDIHCVSALGVKTILVEPPELSQSFLLRHTREAIHKNAFAGVKPGFHQPSQNFTKLRVWELDQYEKLVFIDADALVIKNIDRLFEFPAFGAAPNLYQSVNDLTRMNSGVLVLEPSKALYQTMIETMDKPNTFFRRTDQTFLQEFFSDWQVLPYLYNTLQYVYFNLPALWQWQNIHIIHYQYEKPWDKTHDKQELLNDLITVWEKIYQDGSLPQNFIASLKDPM